MTIVAVPLAAAVFLPDHDRVNVVDGAEVFARPLEVIQCLVGRMPSVETSAFPAANHLLGRDGLELVVHCRDCGLVNVACNLGEVDKLLLRSVPP